MRLSVRTGANLSGCRPTSLRQINRLHAAQSGQLPILGSIAGVAPHWVKLRREASPGPVNRRISGVGD